MVPNTAPPGPPLSGEAALLAQVERLQREKESLKHMVEESHRVYEEKVEALSLLRQVSDSTRLTVPPAELAAIVVDLVFQALRPEKCSLMLFQEAEKRLALVTRRGPYDDKAQILSAPGTRFFMLGEGVAGHAALTRQSVAVDDCSTDTRFLADANSQFSVRSLLCLPLVAAGRLVGVLNLSSAQPKLFTKDHERLLAIVSGSLAVSLDNTRLYQELELRNRALSRENVNLKHELQGRFSAANLVGHSPAFQRVLRLVERVADLSSTVLVRGESGTGKEMVAKALHYDSSRSEGPFVALNCAALPENLLEAELFGIERGVATGVESRVGRFEQAQGGTLFLDEIGDMSLPLQAKMLRVLQEREVQRVGGKKTVSLDVRLVAATHVNLEKAIAAGRFRQDLYYRLCVVSIDLPPLRERHEDILLLANVFLQRFSQQHGKPPRKLDDAAIARLSNYDWPGNVRELQNVLEQAFILSDGSVISADALPAFRARGQAASRTGAEPAFEKAPTPALTTAEEKVRIVQTLEICRQNRSLAARRLGMSRHTFLQRLKEYDLNEQPGKRGRPRKAIV